MIEVIDCVNKTIMHDVDDEVYILSISVPGALGGFQVLSQRIIIL